MSASIRSAEILFQEAEHLGLRPQQLTAYGVFSITTNNETWYLFDGRSLLNKSMAAYLADNKHVTRLILDRNHLPNIPFLLPESEDQAAEFLTAHKQIILKPTIGSHGDGVYLIESKVELIKHDLSDSILEKYVAGRELRYLVLDDAVIAVHERRHSGDINTKTGVKRISYPSEEWDKTLVKIAVKASQSLGLRFSAVDFIETSAGDAYILEVNSAPGIAWFHEPTEGPVVNVARMILEKTVEELRQQI